MTTGDFVREYFPTAAPDYCELWYDLTETWVSGMGDRSRNAYDERETHERNCAQCQKAKMQENQCDRSGCTEQAVEYVLLSGGAVHVCVHHVNEALLASRNGRTCPDCGQVSDSFATCSNCGTLDGAL